MNRKIKNLLFLTVLLLATVQTVSIFDINATDTAVTSSNMTIDGDAQLALQASAGDGSPTNPYILDGMTIDTCSSSAAAALVISNTSKYFILSNANITCQGILLFNVTHGTIANSFLQRSAGFSYIGILVNRSSFITIQNATISHHSHAIRFLNSENNTAIHNHLFSNDAGLSTFRSTNCSIIKNLFELQITTDLYLDSFSNNITVESNTFLSNPMIYSNYNLAAFNSISNLKVLNNFFDGINGVLLGHVSNSTISGNTITSIKNKFLVAGSNTTVVNNTFSNNLGDGCIAEGDHFTVYNNTATSNVGNGLNFYLTNSTIYNNTVTANLGPGFNIGMTNSTFFNNTAIANINDGIHIIGSRFSYIDSNNAINNSNIGISLTTSSNNTLINNFAFNSGNLNFKTDNNNNTLVNNNFTAYLVIPVHSAPDAPTLISVASQTQPDGIEVHWQAPAFDGNSPILHYTVYILIDNQASDTYSTPNTTYVYLNPSFNTKYSFYITATNNNGESAQSVTISLTIPDPSTSNMTTTSTNSTNTSSSTDKVSTITRSLSNEGLLLTPLCLLAIAFLRKKRYNL